MWSQIAAVAGSGTAAHMLLQADCDATIVVSHKIYRPIYATLIWAKDEMASRMQERAVKCLGVSMLRDASRKYRGKVDLIYCAS
jgi:hypothetical protein